MFFRARFFLLSPKRGATRSRGTRASGKKKVKERSGTRISRPTGRGETTTDDVGVVGVRDKEMKPERTEIEKGGGDKSGD